ncbi:MAG: hypothetical protein ACXWKD_08180 [Caldimonas sp.]
MGTITEAQRKWLEGLGVNTAVGGAAPAATVGASVGSGASGASPNAGPAGDQWDAPVLVKQPNLNLNLVGRPLDPAIMKSVEEQAAKEKKEAEETLAAMNKTLADVKAYVAAIPDEQMQKASYATIMSEVRKRFPQAAGLSQWVKSTSTKMPELKGKLPSSKALMDIVESTVKSRSADLGWGLATGKDMKSVNTDRLLAAYMSELPSGVSVKIGGDGVVQITLEGAALSVQIPGGEADAKADKGGATVVLKNDDLSIQVSNEGWKDFDPELRGQWKQIDAEASTVLSLKASRDKAKLELEQKKKDGAAITADLSADFDKREAEFNLAWKKLQEKVTVTAKATEKKISASVAYLKKDAQDKDSVKAGVDAEVDLQEMQGKLKAYYANPSVDAVLEVTAAADKVTAKLELTAVKSGVVVTANFEKSLEETKAAIEVMLAEGKTQIAAELKKKADELSAKLKVVQKTKDMKLAFELEKTLKDVRGSIEVEYKKGKTTVKGGGSASTTGEVTGTAQIDIALKDGRTFTGDGDKLSFTANVSNKGYKFEVAFSMGEPVETASLQDLFKDADAQIKELYRLAGDKGIRSIADAKALNDKLQEVMKPVNDSAKKAKTLKKKSDIAASFGFSISGDWPSGSKASPPVAMFGVKLTF